MIKEITTHLIQQYNPKAILMHGSRVRGDYVPTSDYDLVVIAAEPEKIVPHIYNGCSLDVSGIAVTTQIIETANKVPIWPLEILFEDSSKIGSTLCQQTYAKFLKGPSPLASKEWENRRNYTQRLFDRLSGRGAELMVRNYYLGDFYERMVRYWFEKNCKWTVSFFRALTIIEEADADFYKNLEGVWTEDYLINARQLFEKIFE
jgi:predicted nucleotidyltransferase